MTTSDPERPVWTPAPRWRSGSAIASGALLLLGAAALASEGLWLVLIVATGLGVAVRLLRRARREPLAQAGVFVRDLAVVVRSFDGTEQEIPLAEAKARLLQVRPGDRPPDRSRPMHPAAKRMLDAEDAPTAAVVLEHADGIVHLDVVADAFVDRRKVCDQINAALSTARLHRRMHEPPTGT